MLSSSNFRLDTVGVSGHTRETNFCIAPPSVAATMAGLATATREKASASYYYGLRSGLKLLATTLPHEEQWRDSLDIGYRAKKRFSIVGPHPINNLYETSIQGGIVSLLANISWLSILVARVGCRGSPDDPLTVLILVESGTVERERASQLVNDIKGLHEDLELMDVHIEICEAYPRSALDGDTLMLRSPYTTPNGSPFVGGSIGASHTSAGSLGAILKISSSSSLTSMSAGLTCHHVCFPPSRPHSEDPDKNSASYKCDGNDPYRVTCPSMLDFTRTHQVLESLITKATHYVDTLRVNLVSNPTESRQKELQFEEQKLEGYRMEQSQLADCNFTSFEVFQTSGIHTMNGWIMDWALLSHEFGDVSELNTCPSRLDDRRFQLAILGQPGCDIPNTLSSQIRTNIFLEDNTPELFFKHGRTTSWTAGSMLENPILVRHDGKYGRALGFVSRTEQPFSAPGDSSSLIIDQNARPVAQIFGGEEKAGFSSDVTLATPIELVFDSIKSTLKMDSNDEITVTVLHFNE